MDQYLDIKIEESQPLLEDNINQDENNNQKST